MDDRSLREYALNIYKGIRGYTLSKALSLFPKYYPKIVFYYTEILNKQQNEMSMRMIQGLGIDKGRALLNELNILNERMSKFYVNAKFKLDESYRKIEAAIDKYDRNNIAIAKELIAGFRISIQSLDFFKKCVNLLSKIYDEAEIYNFKSLEDNIINASKKSKQITTEITELNEKFDYYIRKYQI